MNWESILIAMVPGTLALIGVLAGLWNEWNKRREDKPRTDQSAATGAAESISRAGGALVDQLQEETERLRTIVNALRDRTDQYECKFKILTEQIATMQVALVEKDAEIAGLKVENGKLDRRVKELEEENVRLNEELAKLKQKPKGESNGTE